MSIGDRKARPSALQGGHPLVTSRSAPMLQGGDSSPATTRRLVRPVPQAQAEPEPASPRASPRLVRQLHPVASRSDASPPEAQGDAKQQAAPESKAGTVQEGLPSAAGPLVRFVGGFIVSSQARLEQDNDALTALVDSIQRSAQQQPDSAVPSSGEATPRVQPAASGQAEPPD